MDGDCVTWIAASKVCMHAPEHLLQRPDSCYCLQKRRRISGPGKQAVASAPEPQISTCPEKMSKRDVHPGSQAAARPARHARAGAVYASVPAPFTDDISSDEDSDSDWEGQSFGPGRRL